MPSVLLPMHSSAVPYLIVPFSSETRASHCSSVAALSTHSNDHRASHQYLSHLSWTPGSDEASEQAESGT